jgi:2-(1,2-epoxy-1,2-dihydrophenyl)acetyl-CoA isomerase
MSNDAVLYDVKDAVATITLNRPKALNALNMELTEGLVAAVDKAATDPNARCVVLTSSSEHFMAGGDLLIFKTWLNEGVEVAQEKLLDIFDAVHSTVKKIKTMDKPVIVSVDGAVAGFGLSLMLACDLAIAADSTALTLAYIKIGASPDGGSTHSLTRIVGVRKAMEIAMLGDHFTATEAKDVGIINRVVPAADLKAETAKLAARLAGGPTHALGHTKRLINAAHDTAIADQLKAEEAAFAASAGTRDFNEGITAFIEKRTPNFIGS